MKINVCNGRKNLYYFFVSDQLRNGYQSTYSKLEYGSLANHSYKISVTGSLLSSCEGTRGRRGERPTSKHNTPSYNYGSGTAEKVMRYLSEYEGKSSGVL